MRLLHLINSWGRQPQLFCVREHSARVEGDSLFFVCVPFFFFLFGLVSKTLYAHTPHTQRERERERKTLRTGVNQKTSRTLKMQNKHKRRTGHRVNDQRSDWVNQNDKAILFSAHILRISLTSTLVNEKKKKNLRNS